MARDARSIAEQVAELPSIRERLAQAKRDSDWKAVGELTYRVQSLEAAKQMVETTVAVSAIAKADATTIGALLKPATEAHAANQANPVRLAADPFAVQREAGEVRLRELTAEPASKAPSDARTAQLAALKAQHDELKTRNPIAAASWAEHFPELWEAES